MVKKSCLLTVVLLAVSFNASAQFLEYDAKFHDTYLGRLAATNPDQYNRCIAMGPTPYNEANKLCAKATREVHDCARPDHPIERCGGYAFNYAGRDCLEKQGMINLRDYRHLVPESLRGYECSAPGTILVFDGRCSPPPPHEEAISHDQCKAQLLGTLGERGFNELVAAYHGDERAALYGERVGHVEIIAYKSASERGLLSFVSFLQRPIPGNITPSGAPHEGRFIKGCYLPAADAQALLQHLAN